MLGPHWSNQELEHFYEAYRKHGKHWKKVAAVLQNRSVEMAEAVYSLNKAYLSLPEGTASVVGFTAMMTDYYSNMDDRDSDQERNDGAGSSQKPKKRTQRKVHDITSKGSRLHPEAVPADFGCLSLLKKKRSAGTRPCVVGKRTPRFPVSHSYGNVKKGLKLWENDDEEVAHSIAMTLAEASRRSGSLMSSPSHTAERMYEESDVGSGWFVDDDDIEGSMEADKTELSRDKNKVKAKAGFLLHDKKGTHGRKVRVHKKENTHLDYTREACSGTEGQNLGTIQRNFNIKVADARPSGSSHVSKKRGEDSAFDALETLANLSLLISPEANENGKDEPFDNSRLLLNTPANRRREKHNGKQLISRSEAADHKLQTSAKNLVDGTNAASETKVPRKRQKIMAFSRVSKAEASVDTTPRESVEAEATHAAQLVKTGEHVSSSLHSRTELHVSDIKPCNTCTKSRNKRKMHKPKALEVSNLSNVVVGKSKSDLHLPSHSQRIDKLKGELSNCLSNPLMRRWCTFEWFYSAIDEPWFAKREFVEYLYHVGLGHVPGLTRVEWGVIRSSLGKRRRFSGQFLKEEKVKLNQFRDSVRTHYTELCAGSRDGLPTNLARPLSVGQRVLAIYPKTREIHDGTILTIDHNRCHVQSHQPDLGAEIVMDTDCLPLNPFENLPALLMPRKPVNKFFESLNEVKVNGLGNGPSDTLLDHHAKFQAKEADVEAISELTRALDKKEAVVIELRRMNDDVLENQTVGDYALKDSDAFKKQYAAVLVRLNDANAQVSSALFRLRQRNTYQQNQQVNLEKAAADTQESKYQVNEIVGISRTRARTMVDIAIQALSSLRLNPTVEIDKAVDYMNDLLPLDDSYISIASGPPHSSLSLHQKLDSNPMIPSDGNKASVPSDLITQCVATLFIIQKCTERQFPPAEVASILDSAVSSLQPCSAQNLQVYTEIQKCMGIIKNQILALVPT
ncbi:protein ALWAYS EARLY 3-like [Bidens hawaiensis]|uniref:protein ALWAYS EARLY 3-like n=1 Tax=Bidens hawaiensis TaxID=980011 RepID=UPI0040498617